MSSESPSLVQAAPITDRKRKTPPIIDPATEPPAGLPVHFPLLRDSLWLQTQRPFQVSSTVNPHPTTLPLASQPAFAPYTATTLPPAPNQTVQPPSILPPSVEQLNGDEQANSSSGRQLSNSKRAEQNRKAQRAFRERRDQHVKHLESRSQMLDQALAATDEANRRWEETRVILDERSQQLNQANAAIEAANAQLERNRLYIEELKGLLVKNNIPIPEGPSIS